MIQRITTFKNPQWNNQTKKSNPPSFGMIAVYKHSIIDGILLDSPLKQLEKIAQSFENIGIKYIGKTNIEKGRTFIAVEKNADGYFTQLLSKLGLSAEVKALKVDVFNDEPFKKLGLRGFRSDVGHHYKALEAEEVEKIIDTAV